MDSLESYHTVHATGASPIWDAATGEPLLALVGHRAPILRALWNQDESRVLTTSDDGTARLWDVDSSTTNDGLAVEIAGMPHLGRVEFAAWSQDEQRILTASLDGRVRIWDAQSQSEATPVRVFTGSGAGFRHAAWNGDETLVAALDRNSQVWVWDAATGALRQRIDHLTPLEQVVEPDRIHVNIARIQWTYDERRLLVIADGVFQFYTRLDDLTAEACRRLPRNLTQAEWQQVIGTAPYQATCPALPLPVEAPPPDSPPPGSPPPDTK